MKRVIYLIAIITLSVQAGPRGGDGGTISVPAYELPESAYLSDETRTVLRQQRDHSRAAADQKTRCPFMRDASREARAAIRQCEAKVLYETALYKDMRERYDVTLTPEEIGGVYTEVFTPVSGISPHNMRRLLINLHGGGLEGGARTLSHLESIPIAAIGRIKVISIDYRMAPEYTFPAASEDIAAVYRQLLKRYEAKNIGLYGCSAGAWLTAQSIAWFQKEGLPLPGAVGLFCQGAETALDPKHSKAAKSDATHMVSALYGLNVAGRPTPYQLPYYRGVDRRNPLASPGGYDQVMARFPPSLLISGTRDFGLSAVVATHAQLVRLGVDADLHVWEGMSHAFHYSPQLPESREAYDVIVKFFDSRLGR